MFKGELLSVVLVLCFTAYLCLRSFLNIRERKTTSEPSVEDLTLKAIRIDLGAQADDIAKLQSQVSSLTLRAGINR